MNWQNIPKDDKTVKRAIVPKLGSFSFFDYKAVEPRLTAYFAAKIGHPELAKMIGSGIDPYLAISRLITGKDDITEQERQTWKVFFLSVMYGGGIKTIQEQFGVTQKQARAMRDQFHENFPAVQSLQEMVLAVHRRRGYIVGLDGRRLHMEEFGEHKLLNKLIQGSAAGVMKQATIRVHKHLQERPEIESHIVSIIHDELMLDGPEREIPYLHNAIPNLMDVPLVTEVVPILVDHEVSTTSWADKIAYEEWATKGVAVG